MPEAAGRMELAQRLSSSPTERANAALGLSMVRFLAAELPAAIAACEEVLGIAGDLDRELRLGLEFQAAATRLVGGLPSAETFARLLALEQEVSRGETAAERSLLAMMAVVFAATTARTAHEVAALAEAAWGDGQLLVEVRSEHSALAAPATTIALTAATIAHRAHGQADAGRSRCGPPASRKGAPGARCCSTPTRSACAPPPGPGRAILAAPRRTPSPRWRCSLPTTRSSCRRCCPR